MMADLTVTQYIITTIALLQSQSAKPDEFSGVLICDNKAILEKFKNLLCAEKWLFVGTTAFGDTEFSQRYDLAVLIFDEPITDATPANKLIHHITVQRCRDIFAEHTLIFATPKQDFIALGFSKLGEEKLALEKTLLVGWQFNLFNYKQLPDWFNSRFWANPENWNKFRW